MVRREGWGMGHEFMIHTRVSYARKLDDTEISFRSTYVQEGAARLSLLHKTTVVLHRHNAYNNIFDIKPSPI